MKINLLFSIIIYSPISLLCELLKYNSSIDCKSPIYCLDRNIFTFCFIVNDRVVISEDSYTCPPGYSCSQHELAPCRPNFRDISPISTMATTTTGPPTARMCSNSRKIAALNCRQFYECTKVLWWYTLELHTCPNKQYFDPYSHHCGDLKRNNCQ